MTIQGSIGTSTSRQRGRGSGAGRLDTGQCAFSFGVEVRLGSYLEWRGTRVEPVPLEDSLTRMSGDPLPQEVSRAIPSINPPSAVFPLMRPCSCSLALP